MGLNFVIPTTYTAVDKYSQKVAGMQNKTVSFGNKLEQVAARSEAAFSKLPNLIGNATKSLLAYGEAALLIGGAAYTVKGITDYETEIQNLSAVTGATGAKLQEFKKDITDVAHATQKSSVEVAQAFTNVDNNLPQFHDNAAALAEVTTQSIILAKAGRMELGPAAESLTLSMNQFGHAASDAAKDVDALAAGAVAGSSKIGETSDALQVFGSVAANVAKVTYAESVALVELASKFEKGGEAGTRLRNILLDMTNVKYGPAAKEVKALGVNMDIVSNTALPFIDRFRELKKISSNPEAMEKLFDKRNVALASGLFSVIDKYDKIYAATNKAGTAQKMASTNTDTLTESLHQLAAAWTTETTTSDRTAGGVNKLKTGVRFLTNNLDTLIDVTEDVLAVYVLWKAQILLTRGALWAYNVSVGIARGLTSNLTGALSENVIAFNAETQAIKLRNFALKGGTFWTLLALSSYKALRHEIDENAKVKSINPLGLDFNKDAAGNADKLKQFNVPEAQFNQWKEAYQKKYYKIQSDLNNDWTNNPIGVGALKLFKAIGPRDVNAIGKTDIPVNADSVRNSVDAFYNKKDDDDVSGAMKTAEDAMNDTTVNVYNTVNVDKNGHVDIQTNAKNVYGVPVNIGSTKGQR